MKLSHVMEPPLCPLTAAHGQMVERAPEHQSDEQKWCGQWWRCRHCTSSVLVPSSDLKKRLAEQRTRQENT